MRDGIGGPGREPRGIRLAAERVGVDPARVVVGGADARPAVPRLLDDKRLARQSLGHLLGTVVGLGPNRGELVDGRHRARIARRS